MLGNCKDIVQICLFRLVGKFSREVVTINLFSVMLLAFLFEINYRTLFSLIVFVLRFKFERSTNSLGLCYDLLKCFYLMLM